MPSQRKRNIQMWSVLLFLLLHPKHWYQSTQNRLLYKCTSQVLERYVASMYICCPTTPNNQPKLRWAINFTLKWCSGITKSPLAHFPRAPGVTIHLHWSTDPGILPSCASDQWMLKKWFLPLNWVSNQQFRGVSTKNSIYSLSLNNSEARESGGCLGTYKHVQTVWCTS